MSTCSLSIVDFSSYTIVHGTISCPKAGVISIIQSRLVALPVLQRRILNLGALGHSLLLLQLLLKLGEFLHGNLLFLVEYLTDTLDFLNL